MLRGFFIPWRSRAADPLVRAVAPAQACALVSGAATWPSRVVAVPEPGTWVLERPWPPDIPTPGLLDVQWQPDSRTYRVPVTVVRDMPADRTLTVRVAGPSRPFNRRRAPRVALDTPAVWQAASSGQIGTWVRDGSLSGVRFFSPAPLVPGSTGLLAVHLPGGVVVRGTVRIVRNAGPTTLDGQVGTDVAAIWDPALDGDQLAAWRNGLKESGW